jgi:hypothetical protein
MRKTSFTPEEQIEQLWDNEQVKTVMAKHAYLLSGDQRRRELNELWVQQPQNRRTASLGFNNGFYSGMDEIARCYVVEHEAQRQQQATDANAPVGTGCLDIHSANTPVIYVAEDGRTAKYLAFDFGLYTVGKADGDCDAYFISGNIYCDLIKEDGDWKIWHLVLEHDHAVPVGQDYGVVPQYLAPGDDPLLDSLGEPTVPRTVHDPMLGWEHLYQDMPKAHYTYDPLHSYGPDGDLGMRYYERERRY